MLLLACTEAKWCAGGSSNDGLRPGQRGARGDGPVRPHSDADQLTDGEENALGTEPRIGLVAADSDGLGDGDEETYHTDPLDANSDNDQVGDGQEVFGAVGPVGR